MKRQHIAAMVAAAAVIGFVGVQVSLAARHLTDQACSMSHPDLPGWSILLASVAAFTGGHFVAGRRAEHPGVAAPAQRRWWNGPLAVHTALVLFFVCGFVALAYEAVGVWDSNPWHVEPLTHYARCARDGAGWQTLLVSVIVSYFLGHWLWFPRRRRV